MPPFVLIGLAAGIASAVLFASATAGNPAGRLLLFFLAPLPGFLAGLGWGAAAAAISAAAASLACAVILSPMSGGLLFLSQGLPITALSHLAHLSRDVPVGQQPMGGSGPAATPVEWYPVGRLVAVATLMAGLLAFLTVLLIGSDLDETRKLLREMLEKVFLQNLPMFRDRSFTEPEIAALTELMLYTLPAASALSWLTSFLLNLYLAGRITVASGRLPRPWPDLPALAYPRGFGIGLALALGVVVSTSGYPALFASGFAGAFLFAYLLLGLAIVHYVTRGATGRPFILSGLYLGLFFLNTWAALALAVLGVVEPLLPWRRWRDVRRPGPD